MNEESVKPEQPEPTEPKRRWYQYSLRSLLIVMVLLCFLFAWVGTKMRQAEKQKEVVAWVKKNEGDVTYDFELDANGEYIPNAKPPGPDWLHEWIGIDYFSNVEKVHFFFGLTDFELTPLQGLPYLKRVGLSNEPSNQALQKLQKALPFCEYYYLSDEIYLSGRIWRYKDFSWCKQCNDWHLEGSDPHTAPD